MKILDVAKFDMKLDLLMSNLILDVCNTFCIQLSYIQLHIQFSKLNTKPDTGGVGYKAGCR